MARTQSLSLVPGTVHSVPFVELRHRFRAECGRPAVRGSTDAVHFELSKRDGSESEIEMAVREALANAVVHGNCEAPHKRVYVECRCYVKGDVSITVRDEGQGFDSSTVPDPATPENRLLTHGRGIYLMKTLMDEVSFEKAGSIVRMRKKSNASAAAQRRAK